MEFIEIEYNQDLKPLEKLLSGVKRSGDFFISGALELPMPKVDIEGVGTLSFPVPEEQIAAIVRRAERAPYGKGEKTIVDTSVRQVWQISPATIRINGKSWPSNFESILSKVHAGLGCEGAAVSAELYKLLVYDKDGFFLPHRDTEKTDGMFGTLVVTLPSAHRGGGLRIRHAGREVKVDASATEFSELSYVAFYADCEHEALPVREGNRVCLVYNLVQKLGKRKDALLKAPEHEFEIAGAAAVLRRFLKEQDAPPKIAWLLEHQYSPAGLSFSALKGADAAKAAVLVQAAARAQCVAHLGIVHIGDSGAAQPEYGGGGHYRSSSRWNRYRDEDDGDEEDDDEGDAANLDAGDGDDGDGEDFTVITVDDSWQYVDEWRDARDQPVDFGPIPLADGELVPAGALDGEKPDKQRLTEASGNEGATYQRSYHRAALVVWPQLNYADVLLQAGVVAGLPYLKKLVGAGSSARKEADALARRIVDAWMGDSERWDRYPVRGPESSHRVEMLALLEKLDNADLLERFIVESVTPRYDGSENAALIDSVRVLGGKAAAALSALVAARMHNRPSECAQFLLELSENPSNCLPEIAEAAVEGIDRIGKADPERDDSDWEPEKRRRSIDPQFVITLLEALERFKSGARRETASRKLAARPGVFNPVTVVVPALEQMLAQWNSMMPSSDSSVLHLWTRSAEFLLQRSEFPPESPSDWRQEVKLSCSCADCRELQAFTRDPIERVHRFRIKKERREHLHRAIDKHRLDMTHVTDRKGSPQTLVCTKNRRSFERRLKQYAKEIAAMRTLLGLTPMSDAVPALRARMQAAVGRNRSES